MSKFRKYSFLFGLIGGALSAITGTSASATIAMPRFSDSHVELLSKWNTIRDNLNEDRSQRTLSPDVMDVLRSVDPRNGIENEIELSYGLARPDEVDLLDELWLETLIATGDSEMISLYLVVRSRMDSIVSHSGKSYMDRWLWEVQGGGDCDGGGGGGSGANNGHGNGDQTAPGESADTNNAENSENSGQGNSGNGGT